MKELYNLGLKDQDIKEMLNLNPILHDLNDNEIIDSVNILKSIGCNEKHIRNILIANSCYFGREKEDILNLITKLHDFNFTNIHLLFASNPFLLNKDAYEIEEYIEKESKLGKTINDIIEEIELNPYIIDKK